MAVGMMGMFIIHPRDGEAVPRRSRLLLPAAQLGAASGHLPARSRDHAGLRSVDLQQQGLPGDRAAGRAHRRARAHPRRQSLDVESPDPSARRASTWSPARTAGAGRAASGGAKSRRSSASGRRATSSSSRVPGDWAFHCHMAHHTMNAMGHDIPNTLGVDQTRARRTRSASCCPATWRWAQHGMAEHQDHVNMGHMQGPENTLPMMTGKGPFGNMEMGGMFTRGEGARRPGARRLPRSRLVSGAQRHRGRQDQ